MMYILCTRGRDENGAYTDQHNYVSPFLSSLKAFRNKLRREDPQSIACWRIYAYRSRAWRGWESSSTADAWKHIEQANNGVTTILMGYGDN